MHYNGQTKNYTLNLAKKAKRNWKLGLGVDLFTADGWDVSVGYEREQAINSGYSGDSWTLDIGLKF
jgi:hypothetical protein